MVCLKTEFNNSKLLKVRKLKKLTPYQTKAWFSVLKTQMKELLTLLKNSNRTKLLLKKVIRCLVQPKITTINQAIYVNYKIVIHPKRKRYPIIIINEVGFHKCKEYKFRNISLFKRSYGKEKDIYYKRDISII